MIPLERIGGAPITWGVCEVPGWGVMLPADRPLIVVWHGRPAEPVALEPAARAAMEELVGRSANGQLVIAEGSGHYITFDRPDVVIDAVRRVVEAARAGQPLAR